MDEALQVSDTTIQRCLPDSKQDKARNDVKGLESVAEFFTVFSSYGEKFRGVVSKLQRGQDLFTTDLLQQDQPFFTTHVLYKELLPTEVLQNLLASRDEVHDPALRNLCSTFCELARLLRSFLGWKNKYLRLDFTDALCNVLEYPLARYNLLEVSEWLQFAVSIRAIDDRYAARDDVM